MCKESGLLVVWMCFPEICPLETSHTRSPNKVRSSFYFPTLRRPPPPKKPHKNRKNTIDTVAGHFSRVHSLIKTNISATNNKPNTLLHYYSGTIIMDLLILCWILAAVAIFVFPILFREDDRHLWFERFRQRRWNVPRRITTTTTTTAAAADAQV